MISGRVRALNLTVPLGYGPGSGFSFEPVQTSTRYTSALKYQGESHHSLRSIDPAPNPTLRID